MKTLNLSFERTWAKSGIAFVVGIDEAGRGPLAGPVVAAACAVLDPSSGEHLYQVSLLILY